MRRDTGKWDEQIQAAVGVLVLALSLCGGIFAADQFRTVQQDPEFTLPELSQARAAQLVPEPTPRYVPALRIPVEPAAHPKAWPGLIVPWKASPDIAAVRPRRVRKAKKKLSRRLSLRRLDTSGDVNASPATSAEVLPFEPRGVSREESAVHQGPALPALTSEDTFPVGATRYPADETQEVSVPVQEPSQEQAGGERGQGITLLGGKLSEWTRTKNSGLAQSLSQTAGRIFQQASRAAGIPGDTFVAEPSPVPQVFYFPPAAPPEKPVSQPASAVKKVPLPPGEMTEKKEQRSESRIPTGLVGSKSKAEAEAKADEDPPGNCSNPVLDTSGSMRRYYSNPVVRARIAAMIANPDICVWTFSNGLLRMLTSIDQLRIGGGTDFGKAVKSLAAKGVHVDGLFSDTEFTSRDKKLLGSMTDVDVITNPDDAEAFKRWEEKGKLKKAQWDITQKKELAAKTLLVPKGGISQDLPVYTITKVRYLVGWGGKERKYWVVDKCPAGWRHVGVAGSKDRICISSPSGPAIFEQTGDSREPYRAVSRCRPGQVPRLTEALSKGDRLCGYPRMVYTIRKTSLNTSDN